MRTVLILIALTCFLGLSTDVPVQAESNPDFELAAAEVKPLSGVLQTVKQKVPGQVLDIQLDKSGTPWTYRIRIRNPKGNVVLVVVDAERGTILSTKGDR